MKLVLNRDKIKRQIEAPFEICASAEDLAELVRQIDVALSRENFTYGWITVYPAPQSEPKSKPRNWES